MWTDGYACNALSISVYILKLPYIRKIWRFSDCEVNHQIKNPPILSTYSHFTSCIRFNRKLKFHQNLIVHCLDQIAKFNARQYFQICGNDFMTVCVCDIIGKGEKAS